MPNQNPYAQKAEDYQSAYDLLEGFQKRINNYYRMLSDPSGVGTPAWAEQQARLQEYRSQIEETGSQFQSYGFSYNFDPNMGGAFMFDIDGLSMAPAGMRDYLTGEIDRLTNQAQRSDQYQGFMDRFSEWAWDFQQGNTQVDPFADPNGWSDVIKGSIEGLEDMPDMQALLESIYHMMPMHEYTADALPDLTAEDRMTLFFDDLAESGLDIADPDAGMGEQLRGWLYDQVKEWSPARILNEIGLDTAAWQDLTNQQMLEISKIAARDNVFDDAEMSKYIAVKMRQIKRVNIDEYNKHLGVLAAKGIAHGGAMIRSSQDLAKTLGEAEMSATADLYIKGVQLAEAGKMQAIQAWGNIADTQAELLMTIAGHKTTVFGQYFDLITNIGSIESQNYRTETNRYMGMADLKLKADLGIAGLEVQKYISDRGLDLEELRLEYDNYWKDRGSSLAEHQAEFDNAITAWKTSALMTEMINNGRSGRLIQMADLSLKAMSGDLEAYKMYQTLSLQETLEQRGMDQDQAFALADLEWQYKQFGDTMDFKYWATEHSALLQKELLRMNIQGQKELLELEYELQDDGFWGAVMDFAGGATSLGLELYSSGLLGGGGGDDPK